jgi:peptide-methionine (R)-S-oxide reductase
VNLTGNPLNPILKETLSLGLSFCPTQRPPNQKERLQEFLRFDRKARLSHYFHEEHSDPEEEEEPCPDMNSLIPRKDSSWTPQTGMNDNLDNFLDKSKREILSHQIISKYDNLTQPQRQCIRDLRSNQECIIKPADKGGAIVLMTKTQYLEKANALLQDRRHYRKIPSDMTNTYNKQITEYIKEQQERGHITKEIAQYLITKSPRTPIFYILPKIHKTGIPGRPIVSAINSHTDKLSRFVDNIIRPLVPKIPSYIKDTTHILVELSKLGHIPSTAWICTMDVSALYTNIPHQEGVNATLSAIESVHLQNTPPLEVISYLMRTILERNCFQFNNQNYLQVTGTAMGTAMAPSYANLFMAELEARFLSQSQKTPYIWYRFIDDIIFIWLHNKEDLLQFVSNANHFHPTIKFTMECSQDKVPFLDLYVILKDNQIITRTYHKDTDAHSYLHYKSNHPIHQKKSIPYSQFLRMVRNNTHPKDATYSINMLLQHFLQRGYPRKLLTDQKNKALQLVQRDLLQPRIADQEDDPLIYITKYHPEGPQVRKILQGNQPILNRHPHTQHMKKFMAAHKRPLNLRDLLVHTAMKQPQSNGVYRCSTPKCSGCKHIRPSTTITDRNGNTYNIMGHHNCNSSYIIYLLTCSKCGLQYVGQTSNPFKVRISQHIGDIRRKEDTSVAMHFNSNDHSVRDVTMQVIEHASRVTSERLLLERTWIAILNTTFPCGLNVQT